MILAPILTQYMLYFFSKRRQQKLNTYNCNETAEGGCSGTFDVDQQCEEDGDTFNATESINEANRKKESLIQVKEDQIRDDSINRRDNSEMVKKSSWMSPRNQENTRSGAFAPGSLMPHRGGLEEQTSSIILPDGGIGEGLFGRNRNVSSAY
jgi:hypothetical protein